MTSLALIFIGFSILSVPVLSLTHFRECNYSGQIWARVFGSVLIFSLAGLQLAHWGWLYLDEPWVRTLPYRTLLFVVAPVFWAFSAPLLRSDALGGFRRMDVAHALPVVGSPWLSDEVALPLAFLVGGGYLLALARQVYRLHEQRDQYARELLILGSIFVIALAVAGLGIFQAKLPDKLFFVLYSIAIGLAFLLVQIALGLRPHLPEEVTATAKAAYANSTLNRVDREAAIEKLGSLLVTERLYENPDLNLPGLAQRLGLSSHQLSELVNASLGKSFSRYLREQRVTAAKTMLCGEPSASVLSVGLSVGFSTQSNFYEAFREIEGMTPGQYRKLHLKGTEGRAASP